MKPKITLLTALAFVSVTGVASAQGGPPSPPRPVRTLPESLKPFDANEDGRLDREEYKAYLDSAREGSPLSPWDSDGDGKLSDEEIKVAREKMKQTLEERYRQRFDEADTGGEEEGSEADEQLSFEEFKAILPANINAERAQAAFDRLDTDENGFISWEEFLKFHGLPLRPNVPPPSKPRPETPKPKPPYPPNLPDALKKLDTDGDGILSREEMREAIKNGDWPVRPKPPTDDGGDDGDDGEDDGEGETPGDGGTPGDGETPGDGGTGTEGGA
jgi:Ca2+-binding EF-hand superfamily protein